MGPEVLDDVERRRWSGAELAQEAPKVAETFASMNLARSKEKASGSNPLSSTNVISQKIPDRPDPELDSEGEAYVRAKHTESEERRDSTKGYFYDDEDLYDLADASEGVPAAKQGNGNCVRVCDAKRQVGVDVETGLPTSKYTVVSDRFGSVRTMHPGLPR